MKLSRKRLFQIGTLACVLALSLLVIKGVFFIKEKPPEKKEVANAVSKDGHKEGSVVLTPEQVEVAGIEIQQVAALSPSDLIEATAALEMNGDRIARVNSRVSGRVVSVNASLGDKIRSGQTLARVDSAEVGQAWSDVLKSNARLELANKSFKREETLYAKKVSPEKDLIKARQELGEAEADMMLAREKLRLLGIDSKQVETDVTVSRRAYPMIPIASPLSGVVVEKTVTQGEMIGPDKTLFTVADLSSLWLMIDVYERDFGRIKKGMEIKLSVSGYPGKEFRGRISYIGDIMDEKSRTVKARVMIDNRGGLLKPGMFASASISSGGDAAKQKIIAVPDEAIFLDGSERYVFISEGNGRFAVREVLPGNAAAGKIEIKEGLKEGESVVVKGAFALKSEMKKKMLGDEH